MTLRSTCCDGSAPSGFEHPELVDELQQPKGTETVLLVEDNDEVRTLFGHILRAEGYTVLSVADGPSALALCSPRSTPIVLLLTDLVLPGMGGPELAEELSHRYPGLKVLYVSGYPEPPLPQADAPGRVAFLQKPFRPAVMVRAVRALLDG
jgi:CheY-like chemotaxis protein